MKFYPLVIPGLVSSQDDTSTLLSMNLRVHSTLEAGVDQLLQSVGNRNVTQMSSLLQNLVEDVIDDDESVIADDVQNALDLIKQVLLGDIRGALTDAHCQDQKDLHDMMFCFKDCESTKRRKDTGCGSECDNKEHNACRGDLLDLYHEHITACRALDQFVHKFATTPGLCPTGKGKECHLPHSTWECNLCVSTIDKYTLHNTMETYIKDQITLFENAYESWNSLHNSCKNSYNKYVEKDADCDCKQAECEDRDCLWQECLVDSCNEFHGCWETCLTRHDEIEKNKECLERDRKIDWSATEKIECYIDVLIAKPDNKTLLENCGTDDCLNEYRKNMYKECHDMCVEVDFDGSWSASDRREGDIDVTGEGTIASVRTRHRADDAATEKRCTAHLDLDYQVPPCCQPCRTRPSAPCEGQTELGDYTHLEQIPKSYMARKYGPFLSSDELTINERDILLACEAGLEVDLECGKEVAKVSCEDEEHTKQYAYNLCICKTCPLPDIHKEVCGTVADVCEDGPYDYTKHNIKNDCTNDDASDSTDDIGDVNNALDKLTTEAPSDVQR